MNPPLLFALVIASFSGACLGALAGPLVSHRLKHLTDANGNLAGAKHYDRFHDFL